MTIAYDVAVMQDLVRACQTANDEMQRAQNLIQEVHSHAEWTCKEKDAIDDLMRQCKNMVKKLSEQQWSFLQAVRDVAGDLEDAEKSISGLFGTVESILSQVLTIPVISHSTVGTGFLDWLRPGGSGSTSQTGSSGVVHGGGGGHLIDVIGSGDVVSDWHPSVLDGLGAGDIISKLINVSDIGFVPGVIKLPDINSFAGAGILEEIGVSAFQDLKL